MTQVDYKGIKVNIPDSWDEITLKQYLDFSKIAETIKEGDDSIHNTLKTFDLIQILTNTSDEDFDRLEITDTNDLSLRLSHMLNNANFTSEASNHFTIDGVDYVAKNPNEIDNGEYISLNMLQEQYKNDTYKLFPRILSVLIRPGKMEYDKERKEEVWTPEPFNRRDILNLELRSDIFLNKAKAKDVIPVLTFFLNTKKE